MKLCLQRVRQASVAVEARVTGAIAQGLLVFAGFGPLDTEENLDQMARKILQLRIFPDTEGKMNLSVQDIRGGILVISQFTLYADCARGNRPSFTAAAAPEPARKLYQALVEKLRSSGLPVATGEFGAHMIITAENDGPVTIILEK
jgi:D-aminoacyl-tRNA deacylase